MDLKFLTAIGLSESEADIYLALLKFGTRSISFLSKKAEVSRSTGYFLLHQLLSKGLVTKTTKNGVILFTALHPEHLLDYLAFKERELKVLSTLAKNSIGELTSLMNPLTSKPKLQFYEGTNGAKKALNDILKSEDKQMRAFISLLDITDFVGNDFLADHTKRRIKNGFSINVIRTQERDKKALAGKVAVGKYLSSKREKREVRYAEEKLAFPMTIYLHDDKLTACSSKEENYAFSIQSSEFTDMMKKLFDMLWEGSKIKNS